MTDTERKREGIKETGTFQKRPRPEEFPQRQQKRSRPSTCDFCLRDLEEAIPHSCGHWLCGECITSHSEKSCPNSGLQEALAEYKDSLKRKCASVSEGTEMGRSTQLQQIYTDLFITEGLSEEVMTQHEYTQMEANSHKHIQETPIKCQEIFKPLPIEDRQEALQQEPIRLVLTLGVAGVGKTFSVLKFSLDWAQGSENQDLDLVLPLSFRELNLVKIECYSLLELIHVFHPSLRPLSAQIPLHSKVLFILDGLDESRFPLDFSCEVISEITQGSEVGPLLVNLIRGDLLPNALIWITSRPAAASQIPAECAQRITEVRGFFTDQQKAQYFRRRFSDADQCRTVLSHIRGSRCLYTMCQIPVFCWITATVLDHMLRRTQSGALPQTLTDLYVHFLLVQTQRNLKYKAESSALELSTADCDLLLKLGQLAFEHLYQGNIMFYQEDLEQVGLDLSQVSLCSGLCSEIFKPESVIFNEKIYSFVHFSVQEFMAAVYIYHCFNNNMTYVLEEFLEYWEHKEESEEEQEEEKQREKQEVNDEQQEEQKVEEEKQEVPPQRVKEEKQKKEQQMEEKQEKQEMEEEKQKEKQEVEDEQQEEKQKKEQQVEEKKQKGEQEVGDKKQKKEQEVEEKKQKEEQEVEEKKQKEEQEVGDKKQKEEQEVEEKKQKQGSEVKGEKLKERLDVEDEKQKEEQEVEKEKQKERQEVKEEQKVGEEKQKEQKVEEEEDQKEEDVESYDEEYSNVGDGFEDDDEDVESYDDYSNVGDAYDEDDDDEVDVESYNEEYSNVEDAYDEDDDDEVDVESYDEEYSNVGDGSGDDEEDIESYDEEYSNAGDGYDDDEVEDAESYDSDTVFHSFTTDLPLDAFLDRAMRISLTVATGQLDLFVRFLHGLSLESNYRSLMLLLGPNKTDQKTIQKVIDNLKELNLKDVSPDRSINIFHCLTEMNDQSVHQQIQDFLKTKGAEKRRLSEIQCSALAYMLQMSEQVLEELDLNNYNTSREGRWRLIPAVRNCKKANLSECELTETHCEVVASALEFNLSKLKELDLSKNYFLNDSGVNCLLTGLQSAYCALEVLRIKDCMLTWCSCYLLASALWFNPFHLKELDLSDNFLRDLGMEHLSSLLQNPDFRLQILRLRCCSFSALGCSDLSSALQSNPSHLRELDLSYNELQDSAVEVLCHFLHNPLCALQILRLIYCRLSEVSCCSLASALSPSHLRALDLSDNVLLDSGVELLCSFLQTPDCELQTLRLSRCSLTESSCSALASALRLNPSHLRVLDLSKNPELKDPGVEHLCDFLQNPLCELEILSLKSCGLSNLSCLRLVSALRAHPSLHLRELDLRKTNVTSAGHFGSFTVPFTIKYTASLISNSQTSTSSCMSISVPEEPEPGPSHHRETTVFLPEVSMKSEHVSFRFRCPDSGAFRCSSTGLVFVVTKEAELQYKIIQWDEALLKSSGRTAAGPLYDIECSERAMCELHLPHCEPEHVDQSKSQLSVAHISDSGLSLMEPERITQSHVVICVSGLSVFGLLWKFFDKPKVVSGQVLLFCTPQKLKVNIFLLPRNISVDQVEKKQRSTTQYIDAPSKCRLVIDQHYTVVCPRAEKIQPKRAPFDMDHEPNFHSSFELRLPPDCGLVSISVREERHTEETEAEVWRHELDLKACGALSQDKVLLRETTSSEASMSEDWSPQYDPTTRLRLLRSEFVKNVSNEVLNQLLDKLQEKILNPEEAESIRVRHRADKARYLVDTVLKKGQGAASVLVHTFCTLDSESDLCQKLRTVD
ncbi:hypothetical protein NQD34_014726 [Periophthalmus magnuspinnatus]|nr:hypothetical protein NQD34_014726 [Periophthalmus magnuspinnatus]